MSLIDEFNAATQSLDRILEKMDEADPADQGEARSLRKIDAGKSAANSESDPKSSLRLTPGIGVATVSISSQTSSSKKADWRRPLHRRVTTRRINARLNSNWPAE
jgi:hypothetical protein